MASSEPVIIYRYNASPYAHKIDNILAVKGIRHEQVKVSPTLPRPELSAQLGIAYRRIPVLAIGNDVYCDTGLIASALERRFPVSAGYRTIFPPRKHGGGADITFIKIFSKFYAENALFPLASSMVPWDKVPAPFLKDRSEFSGKQIKTDVILRQMPFIYSSLATHLALIEEQLSDSREWLFDTERPSLADISLHFILAWMKSLPAGGAVLNTRQNPRTISWLKRMSNFIQAAHEELGKTPIISGFDASRKILSSSFESLDRIGFDEEEAARYKVKLGGLVDIAPDDTGRAWPTTGKLVALNHEETIIEVKAPDGVLRAHFPRLGYTLKPMVSVKL